MAVVLVPAAAQRLPLHEEEVPGAGVQLVEGARVDRFLRFIKKTNMGTCFAPNDKFRKTHCISDLQHLPHESVDVGATGVEVLTGLNLNFVC